MLLSKGDKVRLVYEDKIGIVINQHDEEVVWVNVDGKQESAFVQHIEKVNNATFSKNKPLTAQMFENQAPKTAPVGDGLPDKGLQVLFQPAYTKEGMIDYFLIHLQNDSGYKLTFNYQFFLGVEQTFQFKRELRGRESVVLNSLKFTELNDYPELEFKFQLDKYNPYHELTFDKILKPKVKMLRKEPLEVAIIQGNAYVYTLFSKLPKAKLSALPNLPTSGSGVQKIVIEQDGKTAKKRQVSINAEQRVVDLHIEKLLKEHKYLPKHKVLQTQLTHFETQISLAIERQENNMIVIHGLGKGKLKQEIVKRLRFYPEVKTFKNEYNPRFGLGATEIIFEYE